jgi:hypothetical protein|mmetsp:Transcript_98484/g.165794  ORF Transcript_98484/g.165794 Transcript_98484/m.165794 type:complete len:116 (-) Transcript_98484:2795-3142(-)
MRSIASRFASLLSRLAGTHWSVLGVLHVSLHFLTGACGQLYEFALLTWCQLVLDEGSRSPGTRTHAKKYEPPSGFLFVQQVFLGMHHQQKHGNLVSGALPGWGQAFLYATHPSKS